MAASHLIRLRIGLPSTKLLVTATSSTLITTAALLLMRTKDEQVELGGGHELHPPKYPWDHKGAMNTFDHARYVIKTRVEREIERG